MLRKKMSRRMKSINRFTGTYYFLSNFYTAPITYQGITYLNNEAAFQSMKTEYRDERKKFSKLSPSDAKKLGRSIPLRRGWENMKETHMYEINLAKYTQHKNLKEKLLATDQYYLEEGNHWGDREWGTVDGVGDNKLGKILMRIRHELSRTIDDDSSIELLI